MSNASVKIAFAPADVAREGIMADKPKGTWYVSFELKKTGLGKRAHARVTETFPNEREAKKFARAKLVDTVNVSAGTLNPHLPKRTIAQAQMLDWLEEPDEAVGLNRPAHAPRPDVPNLKA